MNDVTKRELSSAEQVIEKISNMIIDGELKYGDKLPPERELIEEFQIGRPALREGLCALQLAGILESRQGSGNYITSNISSSMLMPLTLGLILEGITNDELIQVRLCMETFAICEFSKNVTDEDIRVLSDINKRMKNSKSADEFSRYDLEFHNYFVTHTQNRLLKSLYNASYILIKRLIGTAVTTAGYNKNNDSLDKIVQEHDKIIDAVKAGNTVDIADSISEHLGSIKLD